MDIRFYTSQSGVEYVSEFIKEKISDVKAKNKILRRLELLEKYDLLNAIRSRLIKKLHGYDLYEIVIDHNRVFYRILCSIGRNTCWLLHMFKKKSNNTPAEDIETALNRSTN
jgi:phage-related protein